MLKVNYDQTNGTIIGFYPDNIPYTAIPEPTIEITAEQHADYFAQGRNHRVIDGVWTYVEPPGSTPEEEAAQKLQELDTAAANAYIAGFYSAASGTRLYYDSDVETQKLLDGIYTRTKESDWETKVRYPGVCPSGQAPIRAKPLASDPDSKKTIQFLDAAQIKVLVDDLDAHLFAVKSRLWLKQGEVKTAYNANDIPGIKAVSWDEP